MRFPLARQTLAHRETRRCWPSLFFDADCWYVIDGLRSRFNGLTSAFEELLRAAEAEWRRPGGVTVTLDTTAALHRAMAFYERQGDQPSGPRHPRLGRS